MVYIYIRLTIYKVSLFRNQQLCTNFYLHSSYKIPESGWLVWQICLILFSSLVSSSISQPFFVDFFGSRNTSTFLIRPNWHTFRVFSSLEIILYVQSVKCNESCFCSMRVGEIGIYYLMIFLKEWNQFCLYTLFYI